MGADVYYNISDVEKSVTSVQDLNASIRALLRNVLMNHVVKYELEHIETQKYSIISDVMVRFIFLFKILCFFFNQNMRRSRGGGGGGGRGSGPP